VVKNQGQFDQFVDTLQVMARSAPTDKHLLVTGLMERHQVVAVTGDGTNDGPALAKSNVGFAMGITGTSVAKDASDIVLMDDNFVSIVKAVMWGRNVYDSIRKFLQFQLTVNVGALLISFVSAVLLSESPLQPVQLLWVNLIMDTFAALALATELPTPKLLDRAPSNREESLVSPIMMRNILGHVLYQFTLLMFFVYKGHQFLNVPIGRGLGQNAEPTVHYTMVFNIFVMLQVFNEFNSRKINNEWNVFENVFTNPMFWLIVLGTIVVQLVIVEIGGEVMKTASLSWSHIAFSLLIGILTLIYQQLVRTVPGNWFVDLNSKKDGGADWLWAKLRPKTTEQALPSVTTQSYSAMKPEMKRIFTM
jgi:HAD ATPase, P-type, family IC